MPVRVDELKCSGIGMCEMTAPEVFEIGEDGQAHVVGDPDVDRASTEEAISNCPTGALSFDD